MVPLLLSWPIERYWRPFIILIHLYHSLRVAHGLKCTVIIFHYNYLWTLFKGSHADCNTVVGGHKKDTSSLGQLTSHQWPSFGKGENKGSVLLWYSCFDHSILMVLMREWLQSRISILKHCLMRLWIDVIQLTFVFPFAETRSVDWEALL